MGEVGGVRTTRQQTGRGLSRCQSECPTPTPLAIYPAPTRLAICQSQWIPGLIALFLLRICRVDLLTRRPDCTGIGRECCPSPWGRISSHFPTRRTRILHPSRRRPQDMVTGLHVKDNVTAV